MVIAQTMNPAPRPPSPSAREATQRALRRDNTEELSTQDRKTLGLRRILALHFRRGPLHLHLHDHLSWEE
jgi:hypothetical protein